MSTVDSGERPGEFEPYIGKEIIEIDRRCVYWASSDLFLEFILSASGDVFLFYKKDQYKLMVCASIRLVTDAN